MKHKEDREAANAAGAQEVELFSQAQPARHSSNVSFTAESGGGPSSNKKIAATGGSQGLEKMVGFLAMRAE